MNRKSLLLGCAMLALAGCKVETAQQPQGAETEKPRIADAKISESADLAALEKRSGGRLGVVILDTGTGKTTGYRADERFALASTFKMSLAALILKMAEEGKVKLDQKIPYTKADLMPNSPGTTENLAKGSMTVEELARTTQVTSDNAAANLLLAHIGGPQLLTAFWRSLGDDASRIDEVEGKLNSSGKDKPEDTTTPAAMAHSMAKILTGDALSPASRAKLVTWMEATETGKTRIRAGLPKDWRAGNKTGTLFDPKTGNQYNDIAIVWPKNGKPPLIVTAYYEAGGTEGKMSDKDQAVLAEVGRIAVEWAPNLNENRSPEQ